MFGGQWHHCADCGAIGDMLEFAARCWQIGLLPAWQRLATTEAIGAAEIERYDQAFPQLRAKARKFWSDCSTNFLGSGALRYLRLQLGLLDTIRQTEWQQGLGRFIGSATRDQVDEFVAGNPTRSIFHGHGDESRHWHEVLVVPFSDLPGRISAFLFCYERNGEAFPFRYFTIATLGLGRDIIAPGLSVFGALDEAVETLFVFDDPVLALRTHIRHRDLNDNYLPLVGIWPAAAPCQHLKGTARELVFWGQKLTPDLLRHAKAANGKVVLHDHNEEVIKYLRRSSPQGWLAQLKQKARRWDVVLEERLLTMPLAQAENLLYRLDWPANALQTFIDSCTEQVKQRLAPVVAKRFPHRQIVVNNATIIENDRGWHVARTGEVVSDAILRINRIINHGEESLYQGEVVHNCQSFPFAVSSKVFDDQPFSWLREFLLVANQSVLDCNPCWQRYLATIAMRFHSPQAIKGLAHYGWDEERAAFVFPHHLVHIGGEVERHDLPVPAKLKLSHLPDPAPLTTAEIEILEGDDPSIDLVWAVATFVAHNVMARVFSYPTNGLLTVGEVFPALTKLARLAGSLVRPLATYGYGNDLRRHLTEDKEIHWPVVYGGHIDLLAANLAWLERERRNCIVQTDWHSARVHFLGGNWWKLRRENSVSLEPEHLPLSGRVLSAFLLELARRRLRLWDVSGTEEATRANLLAWAKELGLKPAKRFHKMFHQGQVDVFFELAQRLLSDGHLVFGRLDFASSGSQPLVAYTPEFGGSIWISQPGFNQALRHVGAPTADLGQVSRALNGAGKLLAERELQGILGWLVPEDTWNQHFRRWQEQRPAEQGTRYDQISLVRADPRQGGGV